MKFKNAVVRLLGLITTVISIGMIYLILFKDGKLRDISSAMIIEFMCVILLTVSTKFFWYTSTESSIRTSEQYLEKRRQVVSTIDMEIDDAKEFDDFVEIENISNYNKYISNHCENMTVENYRMSIFDYIHWIFKRKEKSWYMIRYMLKIENRANKQHKLSGHNIRSLTQSNEGLTDDRNKANAKKIRFLWTGAVLSLVSMFFTASIAFGDKADIDMQYAISKMIMYTVQILFSILLSILKARSTVANEDMDYFNRILSIVDKYRSYKKNPYTVQKISYVPKEVQNGNNNKSSEKEINIDTSVRLSE